MGQTFRLCFASDINLLLFCKDYRRASSLKITALAQEKDAELGLWGFSLAFTLIAMTFLLTGESTFYAESITDNN